MFVYYKDLQCNSNVPSSGKLIFCRFDSIRRVAQPKTQGISRNVCFRFSYEVLINLV